nr:calcium-dependent protein kinase 1-like [Ipomoea batatas]
MTTRNHLQSPFTIIAGISFLVIYAMHGIVSGPHGWTSIAYPREIERAYRARESALKLFIQADVDNSGTIDYGEFIAAMLHINKITKEDHLFAAFSYFDKDGSGYITADELQKACDEFGIKDTRLEEMIQEADQDNDGRIDYSEFVSMMQRGTTTMHRAPKNEDITTASYCAIYLDSPYKSAKNHRQLA